SSRPMMLLRMSEVLLEKARILKELENEKFLMLSPDKRTKIKKKDFFKESNSYFVKAQKTCYFILKRFPNFERKGDVYYILAYNAKEFQQPLKAKKFFKRAIKYSKKTNYTKTKSLIALAEFYYNQEEFKRAIPLYEQALKEKKNKWYTKDLFNLAWSYFRVGKKSKAINLMRKAYDLSSDPKYINMKYAIERDISYFYTSAGRIKEAIKFYKKIGRNVADNLVKVGRFLLNKGKFTSSEIALSESLNYSPSQRMRVTAYLSLLALYDKFGKNQKHLNISEKLLKEHQAGRLGKDQKSDYQYHLEKYSAMLQKQVAGNVYVKLRKIRRRKARQAVRYFELLAEVDPERANVHYYFAGETFFAIKSYLKALKLYDKSRIGSLKKNDEKYNKLAVTGMLACLGNMRRVDKKVAAEYFPIVYSEFIRLYPKNPKTSKLIQRLFNFHMDKKQIGDAEKQIHLYTKLFPKDYKIQEAMLARIIDYFKGTGDRGGIKRWVAEINRGNIKVSKKYATKLRYILLALQFEDVEKLNTKGSKKQALQGYMEIYNSNASTKEAKKNAAYNVGVLFHELGHPVYSGAWIQKAVDLMNGDEISKFSSSFLVMISDIHNQTQFTVARKLYQSVFDKLCKRKDKDKNNFFKNYMTIAFMEEKDIPEPKELFNLFNRCKIETKTRVSVFKEYVNYHLEKKVWSNLTLAAEIFKSNKVYWEGLFLVTTQLAWRNYKKSQDYSALYQASQRYFNHLRNQDKPIAYQGVRVLSQFETLQVNVALSKFLNFNFEFPRDFFAKTIQRKISELATFKAAIERLYEYGDGNSIVLINRNLMNAYSGFVKKLNDFVPPGFNKDDMRRYKGDIRGIVQALEKDRMTIKQTVANIIVSEDILSSGTKDFILREESNPVFIKVPAMNLMDRVGRIR
ncbi:MAG: hypothetical protein ACPGJV_04235, partial [Bacteriovoracaceae bacterium]